MVCSHEKLVVARAPLRVSLAGGGTDLPSYAARHGGLVIGLAIDRYVRVAAYPHEFSGMLYAALDHEAEVVEDAKELRNRFAGAAMLRAGVSRGLQVASFSDVPSGTGLGGSGAFTVALLQALAPKGVMSPDELARQASAVEIIDLRRSVGRQDHYMAAFGGLQALHVGDDGGISPEPLPLPESVKEYFSERLQLYFTGLRRDADDILSAQDTRTRDGVESTISSLRSIHSLADSLLPALRSSDVTGVGAALDEHWRHKKRLNGRVTTPLVDSIYSDAKAAGAEGGKLLGAGGGGFLLLAAQQGRGEELRAAMAVRGLRELRFGISETGSSSTTLHM